MTSTPPLPKTTHLTLIVEDDPDSFEWIQRRIEKYGFTPEWASSLSEGLEKLNEDVEYIILDLSLPDGSGAEILRAVRKRHLPIKVAVVSGSGDDALWSDAISLKPDAFFRKPVDAIELISWLSAVRG